MGLSVRQDNVIKDDIRMVNRLKGTSMSLVFSALKLTSHWSAHLLMVSNSSFKTKAD